MTLQEAGRLLPCGMDKWVHVNCAVWSAEVYEEHSGLLGMVHTAINRGAQLVSLTQLGQGFIQDLQLGGTTCWYLNKRYLRGSGGMLPQNNFEF